MRVLGLALVMSCILIGGIKLSSAQEIQSAMEAGHYGRKVQVKSVSLKVHQNAEGDTLITPVVVAEFSNSCTAPQSNDELLETRDVDERIDECPAGQPLNAATDIRCISSYSVLEISLIQVLGDRACIAAYRPVTRTIELGSIWGISPAAAAYEVIEVNGVEGTLTK